MRNVTDETSNPFGMRPPFERNDPSDVPAIFGYGDANADFHPIGDHPGRHGGERSGIPFTGSRSGAQLLSVFRELGFVSGGDDRSGNDDEHGDGPHLENLFCSYLHMCTLPDGRSPTETEYATLERFFDAELRAINAHVLLPVGDRPIEHVLRKYTTQRDRIDLDASPIHATEIRGRGFMVVPIRDPAEWERGDRERLVETLESILASDYRQTKGVATLVG